MEALPALLAILFLSVQSWSSSSFFRRKVDPLDKVSVKGTAQTSDSPRGRRNISESQIRYDMKNQPWKKLAFWLGLGGPNLLCFTLRLWATKLDMICRAGEYSPLLFHSEGSILIVTPSKFFINLVTFGIVGIPRRLKSLECFQGCEIAPGKFVKFGCHLKTYLSGWESTLWSMLKEKKARSLWPLGIFISQTSPTEIRVLARTWTRDTSPSSSSLWLFHSLACYSCNILLASVILSYRLIHLVPF